MEMPDGHIPYSTKELLADVDAKIDRLSEKVDQLLLFQASLPAQFVTKAEYEADRDHRRADKRFLVTSLIASFGALAGAAIALFQVLGG